MNKDLGNLINLIRNKSFFETFMTKHFTVTKLAVMAAMAVNDVVPHGWFGDFDCTIWSTLKSMYDFGKKSYGYSHKYEVGVLKYAREEDEKAYEIINKLMKEVVDASYEDDNLRQVTYYFNEVTESHAVRTKPVVLAPEWFLKSILAYVYKYKKIPWDPSQMPW